MKFATLLLTSALATSSASAFTAAFLPSTAATQTVVPSAQRQASHGNAPATRLSVKVENREIVGAVQPVNNFILVKIAEAADKTDAGILLSESAKIQKTEGTVVAVGPGITDSETGKYCPIPLQPGDGVVYGEFDGTELDVDGVKHTLIRDTDVLVKFGGGELKLDSVDTISDKVLVHVDFSETQTEGGLLLGSTKNSEKRPSTGTVMKVGPGRIASNGQLSPMSVSQGDTIKFRDYAGGEVVIEEEEYTVVEMPDVLARF
uniref:20 kDa chaperonin, chloroplastic n=1 Tax=Craspedostauros australis TaxID=1486917 RepID=A0A7S0F7A8_9STRA|eukprot:CAMPEP_0198126036 /NCGR_PEP_ID=MMETSP1442-20131203/43888_1 /TAXON_ID= /ORGANISM="Craspedostauros australis, Strain CCMP3328" /LENGTH=260 /DNA_ID=CAMNT_0043785743 /DNA_START=14 /DNA_END=796 /DNA_ORIENTATION=+